MDVYDGEGNVVIRSYCASPPGGYAPPGSLAEYADDQLIASWSAGCGDADVVIAGASVAGRL